MPFIDLEEEIEGLFGDLQEQFAEGVHRQTLAGDLAGTPGSLMTDSCVLLREGFQYLQSGNASHARVRAKGEGFGGHARPAASRQDYKRAHTVKSESEDIQRRLLAGERPPWCTHGKGRPPARWIRIAAELGIELTAPAAPGKKAA